MQSMLSGLSIRTIGVSREVARKTFNCSRRVHESCFHTPGASWKFVSIFQHFGCCSRNFIGQNSRDLDFEIGFVMKIVNNWINYSAMKSMNGMITLQGLMTKITIQQSRVNTEGRNLPRIPDLRSWILNRWNFVLSDGFVLAEEPSMRTNGRGNEYVLIWKSTNFDRTVWQEAN